MYTETDKEKGDSDNWFSFYSLSGKIDEGSLDLKILKSSANFGFLQPLKVSMVNQTKLGKKSPIPKPIPLLIAIMEC